MGQTEHLDGGQPADHAGMNSNITHDWDDKGKWLRSMELLADRVVPALSD